MSKPPEGKPFWEPRTCPSGAEPIEGDGFSITPAKRPPCHAFPLDVVIRALEQGDGATLHEYRDHLIGWLQELKRRREADHESLSAETDPYVSRR